MVKRCGLVVERFGSRDVFAGEYCHACRRSNASNRHTCNCAKINSVPFMEVFFHQQLRPKQTRQEIKFLRQAAC